MLNIVFTARNIFLASFMATFMLTLFNYALIDNDILSYQVNAFGSNSFQGQPVIAPLFMFLMFFAALYFYVFLNKKYFHNTLEKYSFAVSNILLGLCIAVGFFANARPFTLLTFVLLFLCLIAIEYINKIRFMGKFYRLFLAFLMPFWLINFVLISQKTMVFNPEMRVQLNIGPVPVENLFIWFIFSLVAVYFFERFEVPKRT